MSKQKKSQIKLFERLAAEWHPEGYNFNGPYTQNIERMSLNYKGKVGTESYFLPANKVDLSGFKHDLAYFSPSPIARMFADQDYWSKFPKADTKIKSLSGAFIYGAWVSRIAKELGDLGISTYKFKKALPEILKVYKSLWFPAGVELTPAGPGQIPTYRTKGYYLPTLLMGKEGIIPDPLKSNINDFFRNTFGISLTTARGEAWKKRIYEPLRNLIFYSVFLGSSIIPKPVKEMKDLYKTTLNKYEQTEEYKKLNEQVNKVSESYNKYLNTVGYFDDKDDFVIKDKINENQAKRAYIQYYKTSKKYFDWVNDYYKDYPGFKKYVKETYPNDNKWKFEKLNAEELDKVVKPVMKPAPPIVTVPNFDFEILDPFPQKETEETIIDIKEPEEPEEEGLLEDEILKILQGIQEKPFETQAEISIDKTNWPDFLK